ncbi:FixH family protein [Thiobacillus sedimenti]|uniref:FixH family protein n=1 Tax=Thiobacillus sedimenti TaxID=3110231 RepID=A0ABZ1CLS6_9PROT|nr:FixH family protein [Thiobacillus sp. SCUT-2]WRS39953.1 FixH family protein [Thiobacillus sp. SCUT-2]
MTRSSPHAKPWYREPWPWFLMSLPATAVVAGLTTLWIAARTADGLVVGDYYKEGLAINQTLERDDAARAQGLVATLESEDGVLLLTLAGHPTGYPAELVLTLAHPTHQGMDHTLVLHRAGGDRYRAALPPLPAGKWHAQLVDAASTWRLAGVVYSPFAKAVALSSAPVVQPHQGDLNERHP